MALCGIDLGTTNSLISVYAESGPAIIPNGLGQLLTPSAVSVLEDGTILVGSGAKDRLITHPDASAASFKRLMGSARETRLEGAAYRAEDLSAFVLRSLKADAERYLGEPVDEVVISVPAYFNDIQRKATLDAGRLAGLTVKRLVNEPTAAALAYGLNEVEEAKFLVFDLGGGTFDVSILDKFEGVMEVRATTGDSRLGGDDFTQLVEALILERSKIEPAALSAGDRARLRAAAEAVKCELSSAHESAAPLVLDGRETVVTITRGQFEQAAAPLLRRLREPVERAVSDAQMRPEDLHRYGVRALEAAAAAVGHVGCIPASEISWLRASVRQTCPLRLNSRSRELASLGGCVLVPRIRPARAARDFQSRPTPGFSPGTALDIPIRAVAGCFGQPDIATHNRATRLVRCLYPRARPHGF